MSTRPIEPGTYWWRWGPPSAWQAVSVVMCGGQLVFDQWGGLPTGPVTDDYEWAPRIPAPDEPRAEPAGGLTGDEIVKLEGMFDRHMAGYQMACDPVDFTRRRKELITAVSAFLARIGFTRLTDADVWNGVVHYSVAHQAGRDADGCIAAFRRAVAEMRKPKGNDPC